MTRPGYTHLISSPAVDVSLTYVQGSSPDDPDSTRLGDSPAGTYSAGIRPNRRFTLVYPFLPRLPSIVTSPLPSGPCLPSQLPVCRPPPGADRPHPGPRNFRAQTSPSEDLRKDIDSKENPLSYNIVKLTTRNLTPNLRLGKTRSIRVILGSTPKLPYYISYIYFPDRVPNRVSSTNYFLLLIFVTEAVGELFHR